MIVKKNQRKQEKCDWQLKKIVISYSGGGGQGLGQIC